MPNSESVKRSICGRMQTTITNPDSGEMDDADPERHAYNIQESTQRGPGLMDFERPDRNNWVKSHRLVGIGLISTSLILVFVYLCFIK